jgi:predicted nuclease with TOPRIM domain
MDGDRTTELLGYVTQMIRDIADFRASNDRQFAELREGLNELKERVSALETRMGSLEDSVRTWADRTKKIEYQLKIMNGESIEMKGDVFALEVRVSKLEGEAA